jgi:transposase
LYLDPPEKAIVLCFDEKSQIQALDRSAPVLPMMPGMPERRSHDYVRHGITTLFAALDVATGEIIGSIHRRHRATEFKKFLIKLDNQVPADLDIHLICDNYATHKSPPIAKWLAAHPRFHIYALHPDLLVVAQPDRAMVRAVDRQAITPRRPHIGLRPGKRHPRLDQQLERRPQTIRLDEECGRDPRTTRLISAPNSWRTTLEALRRNALGFRNLTNYRIRSLLHSGALQRTRQCTLNYEEPVMVAVLMLARNTKPYYT